MGNEPEIDELPEPLEFDRVRHRRAFQLQEHVALPFGQRFNDFDRFHGSYLRFEDVGRNDRPLIRFSSMSYVYDRFDTTPGKASAPSGNS